MGYELTIPVFGRAKTVHALDRAANVSGSKTPSLYKIQPEWLKEVLK
jgi:hypothetical protein